MKKKWLNLILSLTNKIYNRKKLILGGTGAKSIGNILLLIVLEIVLAIVSLPLYLTMSSQKVTAYFAEKGSYAKVNFDYSLRRILTVTGLMIVAIIWLIKLLLILVFPATYGPLQLYSISGFEPVDIASGDIITAETGIQTARTVNSMPKPSLSEVRKVKGSNYSFFGQGQPNTTVVLILSDISSAVYTADIDKQGRWQIDHDQTNFKLSEGNHSVVIFGYDANLGVRSETAPEQYFKVTTSSLDYLVKNIDFLANWSVSIIILIGVFLIFLTI